MVTGPLVLKLRFYRCPFLRKIAHFVFLLHIFILRKSRGRDRCGRGRKRNWWKFCAPSSLTRQTSGAAGLSGGLPPSLGPSRRGWRDSATHTLFRAPQHESVWKRERQVPIFPRRPRWDNKRGNAPSATLCLSWDAAFALDGAEALLLRSKLNFV